VGTTTAAFGLIQGVPELQHNPPGKTRENAIIATGKKKSATSSTSVKFDSWHKSRARFFLWAFFDQEKQGPTSVATGGTRRMDLIQEGGGKFRAGADR